MIRQLLGLSVVLALAAPASADPRAGFEEGLSWLHSFEYERALAAFERAEEEDPRFGLAYWGQAMCYQQLLWGNENVELGRAILARGRERGAFAQVAPRDRRWIAALDVLFGEGDRPARLRAYADAMRAVSQDHPDDSDTAALYGLALLATASRGLAGAHHAGDQEQPQLAGSEVQQQAAAIFEGILRTRPTHPGALHYLIHTWDDPQNAQKALEAARVYPRVAPQSSHARHMPAHVFLQLGMWEEAIASDEAADAAAQARVDGGEVPVTAADFHPLSWLVYEYTQLGRFDEARRALERLSVPAGQTQDPRLLSLLATLRSRIAVEAQAWRDLSGPDFVNYDELFAVGYAAAQRGELGLAERARVRLTEMAAAPRYAQRRQLLDIMALQVGAAIRERSGDVDGALGLLAAAAAAEEALPAAIGPPPLIKPAGEQYAEALLQAGRRGEAVKQFDAVLARARNRRLSVAGRTAATTDSRDWRPWAIAAAVGVGVIGAAAFSRVRTRRRAAAPADPVRRRRRA